MKRYGWARWGDVNAFFGLMIDNVTVMVLLFTLISSTVPIEKHQGRNSFTPQFVVTRMIPGTALGVLFGDLVYTWMAFRLARRTGRAGVTAMPLGLDTPSTFGVAFLILLPTLGQEVERIEQSLQGASFTVEDHERAMTFAWHVGLTVLVLSGIFKVICAPLGNAIRRCVPRAGLLGSLAAIALALIAFLPLLNDIVTVPVVGMVGLTVVLVSLVARRQLPGRLPGALGAVLVGVLLYMVMEQLGLVKQLDRGGSVLLWNPLATLPAAPESVAGWVWWERVWLTALEKLPLALPFALATVVGGIDCVESAAAVGDEYDTRTVLLTEGVGAVLAGLLGGVIQTTPYIGHPAYKAMGGRAAYTLATALFIGAAGVFGLFDVVFQWLPPSALFGILVFIGLEITAQSYHATPNHHYPAVVLATLPALACLAAILVKQVLPPQAQEERADLVKLWCLSGGFIITSLLWGSALAALLDGRLRLSAVYLGIAGVSACFGIIHSPFPAERIALPHQVWEQLQEQFPGNVEVLCQSPYHWTAAYLLSAALLLGLSVFPINKKPGEETEERPEGRGGIHPADG